MKKNYVISVLKDLPKEFSLDELMEKLLVIEKIENGLRDVKKGKTLSHERVKREIAKWRK